MGFLPRRHSTLLIMLALASLTITSTYFAQTTEEPPAPVVGSGGILAWVADAAAPGQQGPSAMNQVILLDPDNPTDAEIILDLGTGTTRVVACGNDALSPDDSQFAFMATRFTGGVEVGTLYLHASGATDITTVADGINPIACLGNGTFQWSGERFGYLSFPAQLPTDSTPVADLQIVDSSDSNLVDTFENVVAFDLTPDGGSFVGFFPDENGLATEAGIFSYDGTSDREVSTLRADENCFYSTASVVTLPDGRIATQIGSRCPSGTEALLFLVDPDNRTSERIATEASPGGFFTFTRNNSLFAAPGGETIFATLPDGVNNQSVGFNAYTIEDRQLVRLFDQFGVMPGISDLPYDANNATPQTSTDGRWLAIVRNTGNADATLTVYDLNAPELPPITTEAGDRGETVSWMAFGPDSDFLYFVAGGDEGANNALFQLELATGSVERLSRGRYAQAALAPTGTELAIMSWTSFADDEPPYLTLERLNIQTLADEVLREGGVVIDGELTEQSFAYPLAWRP